VKKRKKREPPRKDYRKVFREELIRTLRAFEMVDCWERLTNRERDRISLAVVRPIRIERDAKSGVETKVLNAFREDIAQIIRTSTVKIPEHATILALHDFMTAAVSLSYTIKSFISEANPDFPRWSLFLQEIDSAWQREDFGVCDAINMHLIDMCQISSLMERAFYSFVPSNGVAKGSSFFFYSSRVLVKTPAMKKRIVMDGVKRTVIGLGSLTIGGVKWIKVPAKVFGATRCDVADLPVFLLPKTIDSLAEKLEPFPRPVTQIILESAFRKQEFAESPSGGRFLVVRCNRARVGYLKYRIFDNMVIGTAFLLITEHGTLEGNAIHRDFKLGRFGRSYFELDRLRTFVTTDVYNDKDLMEFFTRYGCGELFRVWDYMKNQNMQFNANYAKNLKKLFLYKKDWELSDTEDDDNVTPAQSECKEYEFA